MRISVVIPTLNEEEYLPRLLESISVQTFPAYEIIVVDGGSSDRTVEVARAYGVRFLNLPGKNEFASRNAGADASTGDVILFTGADVEFPRNLLTNINARMSRDSELLAVAGPAFPSAASVAFKIEFLLYNIARYLCGRLPRPLGRFIGSTNLLALRRDSFLQVGPIQEDDINGDGQLAADVQRLGKTYFGYRAIRVHMSSRRLNRMGFMGANFHFLYVLENFFPFLSHSRFLEGRKNKAVAHRLAVRGISLDAVPGDPSKEISRGLTSGDLDRERIMRRRPVEEPRRSMTGTRLATLGIGMVFALLAIALYGFGSPPIVNGTPLADGYGVSFTCPSTNPNGIPVPAGFNFIEGTNFNDTLIGTTGADFICALGGDDQIKADFGTDIIYGGTGNDRIDGGSGADSIFGEDGNDIIYGGAGGDFIKGGLGDDYISAGDNNDRLDGTDGNDRIYAGNGNDLAYGGIGQDLLSGGPGTDRLIGGLDEDSIVGGSGNDRIWSGRKGDRVWGQDGDDVIYSYTGDDRISGGPGDDSLVASDGNDILIGGTGNDKLYGQFGDDRLFARDGQIDIVNGGAGSDTCDADRADLVARCG